MTTSLVLTAIGPDRPGLVSLLSDCGKRHGANWAGSRMASLAGRFAGMVHFEVDDVDAEALVAALRGLESSGLRIVIERGARIPSVPSRRVRLELVGHDRPGIVHDLSGSLADLGVSIDELHTQVVSGAMSGGTLFKMKALLSVPPGLADAQLQRGLESLANEMMVDLEVGDPAAG